MPVLFLIGTVEAAAFAWAFQATGQGLFLACAVAAALSAIVCPIAGAQE